MFRLPLVAALIGLACSVPAMAQEPQDYLGVPGPISLGGEDYVLSWSSNPQPGYYKQEYLPQGSTPEMYDSMVIVEFLVSDMALTDVVAAQMNMINQRKATDPIANMAVFDNQERGELLLDFILSAKDDAGEYILEWNGYRYAEAELDGQDGSLLFAVSERSYGNDNAEAFLRDLREFKAKRSLDLTSADLPQLR